MYCFNKTPPRAFYSSSFSICFPCVCIHSGSPSCGTLIYTHFVWFASLQNTWKSNTRRFLHLLPSKPTHFLPSSNTVFDYTMYVLDSYHSLVVVLSQSWQILVLVWPREESCSSMSRKWVLSMRMHHSSTLLRLCWHWSIFTVKALYTGMCDSLPQTWFTIWYTLQLTAWP